MRLRDFRMQAIAPYRGVIFLRMLNGFMKTEENIIEEMFNRYLSCGSVPYPLAVTVVSISSDNSRIVFNTSFKAGCTYCCSEITCFIKFEPQTIRLKAKEKGVFLATKLVLVFEVKVEKGAIFTFTGKPQKSDNFQYEEVFSE